MNATSTSLVSSHNPSAPGQAVTYTATIGPAPSGGTVTFTDGGAVIAGCEARPINTSTGIATCEMTYAMAGTHTIVAHYSGSVFFAASDSPPLVQTVNSPTAVELRRFTAGWASGSVELHWSTAQEAGMLGFDVYRRGGGRTIKLNRRMVPAKGDTILSSARYFLADDRARPGTSYAYRLYAVGFGGARSLIGTAELKAHRRRISSSVGP